jgi:hypothetical protein
MRLANHEPPDPLRSLRRWVKRRDLFHLICSLGLVALAVFALIKDNCSVYGWLGIVLFGACSLVLLWKLVTGRDLLAVPKRKWKKITFDSTGFAITPCKAFRTKSILMLWPEVDSAIAFKRDEFVVDCICLLFAREDGTGVEADEEMEGWREFTEVLPTYLLGCRPWEEWFMKVVSPAFAPNPTEIFSRKVEAEPKRESGESSL